MNNTNYDFLVKIGIVGDNYIGKTCLLTRFNKDYFKEEYISFGVDPLIFKKIEIENKLIKYLIFDTSQGSDPHLKRYNQTSNKYLKCSDGVILIYDITNLNSFKLIKTLNKELNENGLSNLKRLLVGTKCDLEDKRQVTEEEGKKLAKELGINNFFEVSAKTGKNVEEAYYSLLREILMDYNEPAPIILNNNKKIDEKKNRCAY